MTYVEAMELVGYHRMIRRAGWDRLEAVSVKEDYFDDFLNYKPGRVFKEDGSWTWEGDTKLVCWRLDNGDGNPTGTFGNYEPTAEDLEATDWEVYDETKLWAEDEE